MIATTASTSADGPKAEALKKSLVALNDLEMSVNSEKIDDPNVLLRKINKLTDTLNGLMEVGRTMDESSMFAIPFDMLSFLDEDISNPELYQYKMYEETEAQATTFANRMNYLQVVKTECEQSIAQESVIGVKRERDGTKTNDT